ncbi:M15 family metallopeptidase [Winogradskyella thalassocola]|uniref:D-alanyl-D-alanine carboxypeptidase n=1 Tax=Winogradskyella thalassocola TaxID=262004 RepID=A0A1G8BLZ8_9FLAO|nr:M15 family metallopeptidase [Winogradskyella thalassocola]SDH34237.1 D-alanyl-D-alanine carboxypeptidase [Winogradskyella thalassocola]
MKLLVATFSLFISLFYCNASAIIIGSAEIITVPSDTIKSTKKLNITKSFVLGKFDYKTDSTFVKVNTQYSAKPVYLKKHVYAAFLDMHEAAQKDGIVLLILSGTRNFDEQKAIWERKWNAYTTLQPLQRALKILEYSSMPSSSRHHWGTDLDLNSLSNSYFSSEKGKAIYDWLISNANSFGFYQVYTTKENNRTGYKLEKWHWSYLPLANPYLEFYNSNITLDDINGFEGFEMAKELHIIEDYVNGISQQAKDYN